MSSKPIIIVCGEPNSVFSELLAKSLKKYKSKKPIIIIGSFDLINLQLKRLKLNINLHKINLRKKLIENIKFNKINIIDINYEFKKFLNLFPQNLTNIFLNVLRWHLI